ncbi:MAG: heme o synthase [Actinomycetota bacterium]
MTRFQKLSIATAASTFGLIAVGGLVRATKSGLGCGDDWPHCHGRLIPRLENLTTAIEFSHRFFATVVVLLIGVLLVAAWRNHRNVTRVFRPVAAALGLVILQSILGAIVVGQRLKPVTVTIHLAVAMILFATLLYAVVNTFCMRRAEKGVTDAVVRKSYARLTTWGAGATFLLLLVGAYVRGENAGLAFPDWPLMKGSLIPALGGHATAHFLHRLLALGAGILVLAIVWRAWRREPDEKAVRALSATLAGLYLAQVMVGAANVWSRLSEATIVAHVALGALTWGAAASLAFVSRNLSKPASECFPESSTTVRERAERSWRRARERTPVYFQLTKPRIIILLLITTVPAMVIAARGLPSGWLVLATLFGGTLAAGSANAINCFYDRDIDERMARTRRRPLPSHRVEPELALEFGIVLGIVSFVWLARTVNILAALLAVAAILFYVFVYTIGLKRSTPQNIVIGGAAGAVPVLVGWAAVTGRVEVPALALFGIIFIWTPPHFWALALKYEKDYRAAGVPMMPVVAGTRSTQRQILLYSLILFGATIAFAPIGRMGALYLASALVLGGGFVWHAVRLWRSGTIRSAMSLFRFSIIYLALLFASMAVDRLVA